MNLNYEKNIIMNVLQRNPDMGKTAVMKVIFMLQQVKGLNLKYDYTIYTYGPYCSDVTEDVDELISQGLVISTMYPYQNYIGYTLNLSDTADEHIATLNEHDAKSIEEVLSFVHGKTAKDLELYSTIIYVDHLYSKNSWSKGAQSIVKKVKEIKPHFDNSIIQRAYETLHKMSYLSS